MFTTIWFLPIFHFVVVLSFDNSCAVMARKQSWLNCCSGVRPSRTKSFVSWKSTLTITLSGAVIVFVFGGTSMRNFAYEWVDWGRSENQDSSPLATYENHANTLSLRTFKLPPAIHTLIVFERQQTQERTIFLRTFGVPNAFWGFDSLSAPRYWNASPAPCWTWKETSPGAVELHPSGPRGIFLTDLGRYMSNHRPWTDESIASSAEVIICLFQAPGRVFGEPLWIRDPWGRETGKQFVVRPGPLDAWTESPIITYCGDSNAAHAVYQFRSHSELMTLGSLDLFEYRMTSPFRWLATIPPEAITFITRYKLLLISHVHLFSEGFSPPYNFPRGFELFENSHN
jgi:hypothetical protein